MRNKIVSLLMATILLMSTTVFAQDKVEIRQTKGSIVSEGDTRSTLIIEVKNTTTETLQDVKVHLGIGNMTYTPYSEAEVSIGSLSPGEKKTATWTMNVTGLILEKVYTMPVTVKDNSGTIGTSNAQLYITTIFTDNTPDPSINYNPQAALSVRLNGGKLEAGKLNNLDLVVSNTGNAPLVNMKVSIQGLTDKITLKNSSTEIVLGSIATNSQKVASFPIDVSKDQKDANTSFTFTVTGTDPNGKDVSFSKTEYITVVGTGSSDASANLEINSIKNPSQVDSNQDFNLSFVVKNSGNAEAKNVKITVEPTAPIVNKTKNIFVTNFPAGSSQSFSVTMFAPDNKDAKNYPVKITVETTGETPTTVSQYAGVFVKGETTADSSKTVPQVIIGDYSYGGSFVHANKPFNLNLSLRNTSRTQAIKNLKVAISSDEGVFIPVDSSSSFYIESIGANASASKSIQLMAKPDAPQKTISVTVDMSYEDKDGNQITAREIISIPVVQDLRLVVDEIVQPMELYVGQQMSVSVQFYNLGKTAISNLKVTAEGNGIDFPMSPNQFVGNFEPGKNDYYDLSFIPNQVGPIDGNVIFTFEDSSGEVKTISQVFNFNVIEMPFIEEPFEPEFPVEEAASNKKYIYYGLGAGALVAGYFGFRHYKKKKADDLNIEE